MADTMIMCSSCVELSEHKNYLELVNLVCYYDYPNANGTQQNYGKDEESQKAALKKAETLKFMPVKAFYCTNAEGEPTFGGHEASYDEDGNIVFNTEKIGVHREVYIKNTNVTAADGTKRRLPCLYAKIRVWTDKPHMVAAIKRLYGLGKLNTSWEAEISQFEFKNGIKYLYDYEFIGNAMLGFDDARRPNKPAYGQDAKVVSMATEEPNEQQYTLMIAEALARDLIENPTTTNKVQLENEVSTMTENDNVVTPATEVSEADAPEVEPIDTSQSEQTNPPAEAETPARTEHKETEVSALTSADLIQLISEAYRKHVDCYAWLCYLFPEERLAWMHKSDLLETEYDQVAYTVQDNEVKIEAVDRVSIALPVRELSAQYDELKRKNESLTAEVATLSEYKSKYEAAQLAEEKQRHEAEVASIRKMVESCGCFTEDEIKELEPQIEQEKRLEIQAKIGLRLMENMNSPAEMSSVQEGSLLPKASLEKESPIVFTANDVSRWLNGN